MNYENFRSIMLMYPNMKLYERIHENRLRNIVSIREEQFGFVKEQQYLPCVLIH